MISKTVCFSGHRPEKLPGKGMPDDDRTAYIRELLNTKIEQCVSEGYVRFMSGVARGIDLWGAETIIKLRNSNPKIQLICVKPIENQGNNFPDEDKYIYQEIIQNADSVICTSETYNKGCYMIRNRYMVDNSEKLIAFVSDYRSGTGQTINYARKRGIKLDITDLSDIDFSMKYEQLTL